MEKFDNANHLDFEYNATLCVKYLEDAMRAVNQVKEYDLGGALAVAYSESTALHPLELAFADEWIDHEIEWWRYEYEGFTREEMVKEFGKTAVVTTDEVDDSQIPNEVARIILTGAYDAMIDWLHQADDQETKRRSDSYEGC